MNETNVEGLNEVLEIFSLTKIALLILGIAILGILARGVNSLGENLERRLPSQRLLIAQIVTITSFFIYILGGVYLLYGVINPPKSLLLATSGTLAVAIGLSMKDLVASVVAGVILIFDRPFQVGDRVTFEGIYGEITTIGLRAVRLVTLDDSIVTIPNSKFVTDAVASGNFGALDMMIEVNFHVDLASNIKLAKEILYETAVTSPYVFLKKPVALVLTELNFANRPAMQIRVKSYVLDVRFEKAFQSDLLIRGNEALVKAGVTRPSFLDGEFNQKILGETENKVTYNQ
ncbi:MAG: mechanosensitive ion channel [Bdellovibrio sp.]|nr:mechanosensitive ion channel [Bdellovibrio sp.]